MAVQQVILVTGSSHGFGRLTALTLARQGHTVFASMRAITGRNSTVSAEMQDTAKQEGLSLHVMELDVTEDASVEDCVKRIVEQTGRIDVLVNNAGVMYGGITEAYTLEQVRRQMEVNFFGVVRMNRAVLPYMRQQGNGLLVHVTSLAGGLVFPFFGLYCASKAALEAVAESYHYELFSLGIDSVIIEPGPFQTNLTTSLEGPQDQERLAQYGTVAEIARQLLDGVDQPSSEGVYQDPQIVADIVAELVAMPSGKRPLRTIAGAIDFGLSPVNEAKLQAQRVALDAWGLTQLTQPLKPTTL
ncbi:SDR family oxidoreductase [Mastigocladopsis repens]|uniref:SDR family oxidoreductase n=1 Tax=Mastigocladopsis repens TaxID=221287 RepID=UPI00030A04C6|nr:SDR family oxidoreductase [Mastigocladopsis repens]